MFCEDAFFTGPCLRTPALRMALFARLYSLRSILTNNVAQKFLVVDGLLQFGSGLRLSDVR